MSCRVCALMRIRFGDLRLAVLSLAVAGEVEGAAAAGDGGGAGDAAGAGLAAGAGVGAVSEPGVLWANSGPACRQATIVATAAERIRLLMTKTPI